MMTASYFQMGKKKNVYIYRGGTIKEMWLNATLGGRYMGTPMLSTFLFV